MQKGQIEIKLYKNYVINLSKKVLKVKRDEFQTTLIYASRKLKKKKNI